MRGRGRRLQKQGGHQNTSGRVEKYLKEDYENIYTASPHVITGCANLKEIYKSINAVRLVEKSNHTPERRDYSSNTLAGTTSSNTTHECKNGTPCKRGYFRGPKREVEERGSS